MRCVAVAVIAALSLGATAACGDDTPAAADPSAPATVDASGNPVGIPTGTVCDLLTLEAVSSFMGQPAQVDEGDDTECVWLAQTDGIYQLHLQIYDEHTYYAPDQWGTPEPIIGLGEEAFLVREAVVGTVAAYWDGQHAVFLNYAKLVGPGSSADKADLLVLLLRALAEKL
jgi:hypothetical protein